MYAVQYLLGDAVRELLLQLHGRGLLMAQRSMRPSRKVALCGVLSALAVVILLAAYIEMLQLAIPAIAGLLLTVIAIEVDIKYGLLSYAAVSILAFIMAEKSAVVFFILFFGYYGIARLGIDKIHSKILQYVIKFVVANAALGLCYVILTYVFGLPLEGFEFLGRFVLPALWLIINVMFLLYDHVLTSLFLVYRRRWQKNVRRIFKF